MSLLQLIPKGPLSRLRLSVVLLLMAVLAPALFRLWCIKGLVRTIRIDGPSMAETLCGNHFRVTCGDCGITFRCDADDFPDDRRAVCPNCGYRDNELRDEDLRRGDRVLVDRWPYLWAAPQWGDIVMLVEPKMSETVAQGSFAVKRVAALPLEHPGIRGGDLVNGDEPVRKSLTELTVVGLLVHDNDFLPRSLPTAQRWVTQPLAPSNWKATQGGYRFHPGAGSDTAQWLSYEHWHCSASPAPRTSPTRIRDNDGYNQAKGHELNLVRDLLLRFHVKAEEGDVLITLQDAPHIITVRLRPTERRFRVLKNGSPVVEGNLPESAVPFQLEAALCDGRFLFAHNHHALAAFQYDGMPVRGDKQTGQRDKSPLQIGAQGGAVEIAHIQVWRDIYYLNPNYLGGDWKAEAPLAEDHFFLLGDNSPVSVDSRQWPGGGVPRESIRGKVIPFARYK